MSGLVEYPAVPVSGRDEQTQGAVAVDPRTGAITAEIAGRAFVTRPPGGKRRTLDAGFVELRKVLRRAGYTLQTCGTCQYFRYSAASREMSAGLSGYCGLGHNELGSVTLGGGGALANRAPVVTLLFSCPAWVGRDERELTDFFTRSTAE